MAAINRRRVWLGALAGGVIWSALSFLINVVLLAPHYKAETDVGHFLAMPRYSFFVGQWNVILFILSYIICRIYASVRATSGAGPKTALAIGLMIGFAAAYPGNFATATWSPVDRIIPLLWMIEMWLGSVLAALVGGWLYRD